MFELLFFGMYAFVLLAAAIGVIASRNPVHSAMFLVLAFVTSAALWLMLEAEFLGIVLVLVYVGAVMVLFLFVVMMLDIECGHAAAGLICAMRRSASLLPPSRSGRSGAWSGCAARACRCSHGRSRRPADYSNTQELGRVLYTEYVYPFELAAFVLLLAIVAAIVLTMRRRPNLKVQDVGQAGGREPQRPGAHRQRWTRRPTDAHADSLPDALRRAVRNIRGRHLSSIART